MTEETLPESNGCISKVVDSWRTLLSTLNVGQRVYPSDPSVPKDCEFIVINSKIHIRVLHIYPGTIRKSLLTQPVINDPNRISKRSSISEEYWFTKWNKPLKIGNCNCSFRRSMRYSVVLNQPIVQSAGKRESVLSVDLPPTKIKNVETFVERLIQDTFFEAFQEYYILKSKNETGKTNLAYETTEDDVIVTLRRKFKPSTKDTENIKSAANPSENNKNSVDDSRFKRCVHKKVQKKPLVMLQHGIGASAEVWSLIINALVQRGFEVVAPDMLGHGLSSAPDKSNYYTFSNLLLQALTIFDHYMTDDKRKCILIGHSYGCSLVTALYPHRAQQIAQLILISGGGPTPLAPPVKENEISPFGCAYNFLHPLLYCGLKRSFFYSSRGKHFGPCDIGSGLPEYVLQNIANGQKWPDGDAAFHRRILIPTLLVHGLQDKNVTLVQECEMERTIPRAFLELIPNAGHMPMLETPEHLIHMIMCFLEMWS
ncbi:protein ABHD8-like [Anoplophora glabripennis]|uniref:protein ABHD8-like n=1 Tax=Anoplophora glabripennis TaxID=217634 RepID=UPI0008741479|nr:protein ABHD8-like [Anoplophora glabripennis]